MAICALRFTLLLSSRVGALVGFGAPATGLADTGGAHDANWYYLQLIGSF